MNEIRKKNETKYTIDPAKEETHFYFLRFDLVFLNRFSVFSYNILLRTSKWVDIKMFEWINSHLKSYLSKYDDMKGDMRDRDRKYINWSSSQYI